MARVQQPIEVAGSPTGREIDANVERGGDGADRPQRQRIDVTAFGARDRGPRDPAQPG
jgi:hypothetical protein